MKLSLFSVKFDEFLLADPIIILSCYFEEEIWYVLWLAHCNIPITLLISINLLSVYLDEILSVKVAIMIGIVLVENAT